EQVESHASACRATSNPVDEAKKRIAENDKRIKWTGSLISKLCQASKTSFDDRKMGYSLYRPFCKFVLYYDRHFNHRYKERLYPTITHTNLAISAMGVGANKDFS